MEYDASPHAAAMTTTAVNDAYTRRFHVKPSILCVSLLTACFSILGVSHCSFVATTTASGAEQKVGLFSSAYYDEDGQVLGCISLTDEFSLDGSFKTGRAFGTLTALWATAGFVGLLASTFFLAHGVVWNICRGFLVLATLSQMFTYSILTSDYCGDNSCHLTGVGVLAVFNIFLLAGLSITVCLEPAPGHPWFELWNDELFTANKDTLAMGESQSPEFMSSHDAEHQSQASTNEGGVVGMEVVSQRRRGPVSTLAASVASSVQDTLISSMSIQRVKSFRLSTVALMTCTWAISIFAVRRCTFILVGPADSDRSDYKGFGLYTRSFYQDNDMLGCLAYSDEDRDGFNSMFQSSRVFGAVAALLMSAVLVCGLLQLFSTIAKEEIWLFIRALLPCSLTAQLLAFLAFRASECTESDSTRCVPGDASIMAIVNVILVAGLSALTCMLPPPPNPVFARFQADEREERYAGNIPTSNGTVFSSKMGSLGVVNEEQDPTEFSDCEDGDLQVVDLAPESGPETIQVRVEFAPGEKKTIKEITHPDGSKTITTTIEELDDENDEEIYESGGSSDDKSDRAESTTLSLV